MLLVVACDSWLSTYGNLSKVCKDFVSGNFIYTFNRLFQVLKCGEKSRGNENNSIIDKAFHK